MFLTRLHLMDDPQPELWVVCSPLIWFDGFFGRLEVPLGFRTDLASTPLHLWSNGKSRRPAVMHDWLYAERSRGKTFADNFLKAAMLSEGCTPEESDAFFEAVHLFGKNSWDTDAGALEVRDFDSTDHYHAWLSSVTPVAIVAPPAAVSVTTTTQGVAPHVSLSTSSG